MTVVADSPFEHELEKCALLQNRGLDLLPVHLKSVKEVNPLFAHYEKHKAVIGKYYNVMDQAFDIVFEKLLNCLNAIIWIYSLFMLSNTIGSLYLKMLKRLKNFANYLISNLLIWMSVLNIMPYLIAPDRLDFLPVDI